MIVIVFLNLRKELLQTGKFFAQHLVPQNIPGVGVVGHGVEQCGTVLAGQLFGFVLQRSGLLSCGAEQVDVLHPLHGVGLVRLLKAGNKGLPQIVHVHAADGDAADAWETASLDSKTELAKQLAAYELAMLGVPDGTEVTVQPLDEDRLGYYSAASRQIVLSRSVLESGTAQETMDTIAHEVFHVQQAYVVENIDWDDAATQATYYDQARRWLRNDQNGYVSGEEDILSYYFQPVEIDARAYAAEETERLQGLIDKELQKET